MEEYSEEGTRRGGGNKEGRKRKQKVERRREQGGGGGRRENIKWEGGKERTLRVAKVYITVTEHTSNTVKHTAGRHSHYTNYSPSFIMAQLGATDAFKLCH